MDNIKFSEVLKSYEEQNDEIDYKSKNKSEEELSLIDNDVKRTPFIGLDPKEKVKKQFLVKILKDLLISIPNFYYQGMSEICSVFVFFYFSKEFDKFQNKEEESFTKKYSDEEYKKFRKFVKKKYDKVKNVLTNVISRKYEPLVKDNFKLYEHYNTVFLAMMKRRNIKIDESYSFTYMNSVLTYFCRHVTSIDDSYKIFEIVLSCPPTAPFLLLIIYFDKISKKKPITEVDIHLYESIILLEKEFLLVEEGLKKNKKCFLARNAVVLGGLIGFVVAAAVYKYNKRADE